MPLVKDEAIALRRLDYSESSQVLVFFTREHGSQRLIAKGIKRGTKQRFATGIDLLERGDVVFLSKSHAETSLGTLTEWRQSDAYLGLRDRLDRWYAAQYAAEITASMTEEADPDPELFDALAALLHDLASGPAVLPQLVAYQMALLTSAGLWPDLTRCVLCNRPAPPGRAGYYSAHQGGLICRNCAANQPETRRAPGAVLDALRAGAVSAELATPVFDLLDYTIGQTMGRPTGLGGFVIQHARSEQPPKT
jgi:DNA repair protein RecO (recombination protein O)